MTRGLDRFPSTQSLKHTHKRGSVNVGLFHGSIGLLQPHLNSSFLLIRLSLLHSHPFSLSGSLLPVLSFPSLKCPGISLSLSLPLYTTLCLFLQYDSISPSSAVCQFNLSVPLSAEFCFRSLCLSSSPSNLTNCFPIANSYITYSVALTHTHTLIS